MTPLHSLLFFPTLELLDLYHCIHTQAVHIYMSKVVILPSMKLLDQDVTLPASTYAAVDYFCQMNKKVRVQNAQWLFFKDNRWIPLDTINHQKLEETILSKGVFVDIRDSHFPKVSKVRVFPELDYLSYLGVRYKISKVLLPGL